MKKQDRVTLHRERLHKEVWETPILQLAKKYGMSDVGLAKVCRRMNVPLPPRGYWAKRAYGHDVRKEPLPLVKNKGVAETTINKSAEELLHLARNRQSKTKQSHGERQRIFRLQAEMKDWETSGRIRAYIAVLRASGRDTDAEQTEFLAWAERYADHLDPTNDFRIAVLDEV